MKNRIFVAQLTVPAKTISVAAIILASYSICTFGAPVFDSVNGHWYDAIAVDGGVSWPEARSVAESTSLNGAFGHLVTITSQDEQDFLASHFSGAVSGGYWLGGSQAAGQVDPAVGWSWVTGETWGFTNWLPGEPNDFAGVSEDALAFHAFTAVLDGHWNDVAREAFFPGFVVEWEAASASVPDGGSSLGMLLMSAGSISVLAKFGREKLKSLSIVSPDRAQQL